MIRPAPGHRPTRPGPRAPKKLCNFRAPKKLWNFRNFRAINVCFLPFSLLPSSLFLHPSFLRFCRKRNRLTVSRFDLSPTRLTGIRLFDLNSGIRFGPTVRGPTLLLSAEFCFCLCRLCWEPEGWGLSAASSLDWVDSLVSCWLLIADCWVVAMLSCWLLIAASSQVLFWSLQSSNFCLT